MPAHPHVVVAGLMGVGKTTVARMVADALDRPLRDSDADIETLFRTSGRAIADELGVAELHRLESAVLLGALAGEQPSVITPAAAVVEDPRAREAMSHRALVAVLEAPIDVVLARIASGAHRRPMDRAELERLARHRGQWFAEIADVELDATRPAEDLASTIVERVLADD